MEVDYNPFDFYVTKDGYYDLSVLDVTIKKEFSSDNPFILVLKAEEAGGNCAYVV